MGEAYTGVALSDPGATLARPLEAVPSERLDVYLRELFAGGDVAEVVVGVPKTLGGEVGFQARRVLERVSALQEAFPEARFVQWDERFTTRVARTAVRGAGRGSRKRRRGGKERVDHLAAAAMLQEYLERRGAVAASP
ncbi:MAG: Holliday junction resolvase RuvX [Actinomycetota bacterium]|nr:Holliday junction resolvase RuvX [Actinomycetota bacterium]